MTDQEFEDRYIPAAITMADCYEVSFEVAYENGFYKKITTQMTQGMNSGGGFTFWYPKIVNIEKAMSWYDDLEDIKATRVVIPINCTDEEAREYTGDYIVQTYWVEPFQNIKWAVIINIELGTIYEAQAIYRHVREILWTHFKSATLTFFMEPGIRQPDITIKGTRNIPDEMFSELALSEVYLSDELEYIGENAFMGYSSSIPNNGFSIYLGRNVSYIGNAAFANWNNLSDIQIDNEEYEFDFNNIFWVARNYGSNTDEDGYQITYLITENAYVRAYNWKENFNRVIKNKGALIIKVRGTFRKFRLFDRGDIPVKLGDSNIMYLRTTRIGGGDSGIALVKINGTFVPLIK